MFQNIPLSEVDPNPEQPREHFSEISALAESIREEGLLEPLMVRPHEGRYQLVHGERRLRAAKEAGLKEAPAVVREMDEKTMFRLSLVENVQRAQLTPMEEALSFARLQAEGHTQKEIGHIIGKGQSYVAHKLRLLKVPEALTYYLRVGALTENHFRQAMRLKKVLGEGILEEKGEYLPALEAGKHFYAEEKGLAAKEAASQTASIVLVQMRPLGRVDLAKAPDVVVEGIRRWAEYVSKHTEERMPVWERHAFWALSMMVCMGANVHDATRFVDTLRDLYLAALANSALERIQGDGPATGGASAYQWAIYHDLKHAGLLEVVGADLSDAARDLYIRALGHGSTQAVVHPSEAQGPHIHARLRAEIEERFGQISTAEEYAEVDEGREK